MDEVGEGLDVVGVGLGGEAVAEVDDVAGFNGSSIEHLGSGFEHFITRASHQEGVEIALDGNLGLEDLVCPGEVGFGGERKTVEGALRILVVIAGDFLQLGLGGAAGKEDDGGCGELLFEGFADGEERLDNSLGVVGLGAGEGPAFEQLDGVGTSLDLAGEVAGAGLGEDV